MTKKDIELEYQCLLGDYADLQIRHDRTLQYCKLLEELLDVKENLISFIKQENEELKNKIRILKNGNY